MGWDGANYVLWHLHLVCVTVTKHAATLADVVHVCEHKFHGMFIFLFAKLAHALGATRASIWLVLRSENTLLRLQMLLYYANISFMESS